MSELQRYKFIGDALRGDGPFRPVVTYDSTGAAVVSGSSYLVRYPRESDAKFAARCELAYYASPLARICSRFVSYITTRPVLRDINSELLQAVYYDVDGKNNDIDAMWQEFMLNAKARGSMLLLVDMPAGMPGTRGEQLAERAVPYWTPIAPEKLTEYELEDTGKFAFAAFAGSRIGDDGEREPCVWRFDAESWQCVGADGSTITSGEHPLGECPVLIFTEGGDFPHFGPFSPVADLSRRLYNLESELDEILRSQTFSVLTLQVPEDTPPEDRLASARATGETIGTSNMMVHTGSTPAFIAPPDGPAQIYMDRIRDLRDQIQDIGLEVAAPEQRESGLAMQMRFQTINASLVRFSDRMEDLERRAWELTSRWLGLNEEPEIAWPRDFQIADPEIELMVLREMRESAMSPEVTLEQQRRIVETQFSSADMEVRQRLLASLDSDRSAEL